MQNLNCPLQYKQILNPFKHESVQQRSCKQQMNPAEKFTAELLDPFLSSHVLLFLFLTALEHISFSFPHSHINFHLTHGRNWRGRGGIANKS